MLVTASAKYSAGSVSAFSEQRECNFTVVTSQTSLKQPNLSPPFFPSCTLPVLCFELDLTTISTGKCTHQKSSNLLSSWESEWHQPILLLPSLLSPGDTGKAVGLAVGKVGLRFLMTTRDGVALV